MVAQAQHRSASSRAQALAAHAVRRRTGFNTRRHQEIAGCESTRYASSRSSRCEPRSQSLMWRVLIPKRSIGSRADAVFSMKHANVLSYKVALCGSSGRWRTLLDHLVSASDKSWSHFETKWLSGLEVDGQLTRPSIHVRARRGIAFESSQNHRTQLERVNFWHRCRFFATAVTGWRKR